MRGFAECYLRVACVTVWCMALRQINLRLDEGLLADVDAARGLVGRNLFLVSLVRFALQDRMGAVAPNPEEQAWRDAVDVSGNPPMSVVRGGPPPVLERSPVPPVEVAAPVARSSRRHAATCKCAVCKPAKS